MKHTIALLLLTVALLSCKSQPRLYCTPPDFTAVCYTFGKGRTFKYDLGSCTYSIHGQGKYAIIGDTIRFTFSETDSPLKPRLSPVLIEPLKDQIILEVSGIDSLSREPISGYSVAMFTRDSFLRGTIGNYEGVAQLATAYTGAPIHVKFSYAGYSARFANMDKPGRYMLKVTLGPFDDSKTATGESVFRLIEFNKDRLILGDFETGAHPRIFTRKTPH